MTTQPRTPHEAEATDGNYHPEVESERQSTPLHEYFAERSPSKKEGNDSAHKHAHKAQR